jgi:5-formyltetrahydrofolate cyclo-ligase
MSKTALRKEMLEKRKALTDEDWQSKSAAMCQELLLWLKTQDFTKLGLFRSFRREPDLRPFETLWGQDGLYYPKTINAQGHMEFFPYPAAGFETGRWGLEEPPARGAPLVPDSRTLILVPGVAYDRDGYRLGYGGGYYDRYFHRHPCSRMGLCFADFLLPQLPAEAHDQRVSYVMTELGLC